MAPLNANRTVADADRQVGGDKGEHELGQKGTLAPETKVAASDDVGLPSRDDPSIAPCHIGEGSRVKEGLDGGLDVGDTQRDSVGSEEDGGSSASTARATHKAYPSQFARNCADCNCELERPEVGTCAAPRGPAYCTRCRFRFMDPFRLAAQDSDVLFMAAVPSTGLEFKLELPLLKQWRKSGHEFELRMIRTHRTESDRDYLHQAWTRYMWWSVNGKEVLRVKPGPRGQKRRDVPYNMSATLKPTSNSLRLLVDDQHVDDFVFAIVRTLPKGPVVIANQVTPYDHDVCWRRVKALVTARSSAGAAALGGELECVGDERLPLRCPITLQRIASVPARGKECEHLQCFDLDAYLVSNYRMKAFNSRWRCPLCSLELRPADLCVDAFVQAVLDATSASAVAETAQSQSGLAGDFGHNGEQSANVANVGARPLMEVLVAVDGSWRPAPNGSDGKEEEAAANQGESPVATRKRKASSTCVIEDGGPEAEASEPGGASEGAPTRATEAEAMGPELSAPFRKADRHKNGGKKKRRSRLGTLQGIPVPPGSKRKRKERQTPDTGAVARASWAAVAAGLRPSAGMPKSASAKGPRKLAAPPVPTIVRRVCSKLFQRALRRAVPPPRHAIDVDSDAPPEEVSDSDDEGEK